MQAFFDSPKFGMVQSERWEGHTSYFFVRKTNLTDSGFDVIMFKT